MKSALLLICLIIGATNAQTIATVSADIAALRTEVLAAINALNTCINPPAPSPPPPAPTPSPTPPPPAPTPSPPPSTSTILVGPTRTYKTPADAIAALPAGGTMVLDDGTYQSTFDIPQGKDGFTMRSASGNPYKCKLDGRGGVGSGYRLAWGKGIVHVQSRGTIQGIGFVNGGGGDGVADGEAGIYAELFATSGVLKIVNCSFDGNENGVFVPGGTSGNNVNIELNTCIFSKNAGNGVTPDGGSHNYYIQGNSLLSRNCIHYPAAYGNNVKTRSRNITIIDAYNRHGPGRCLDIPSGGRLNVQGGVYTAAPGAVSNFFEYAAENQNSGIYTPTINGLTIVGSRYNDAIWNAASGITIAFTNIVQRWANPNGTPPSFNLIGSVTGIQTSPPAGYTYVSVPNPTLPSWAL